jgi:hypothetical protein
MLKIIDTKRTKTIIVGTALYDEYRKYEKHITLFGITLIKKTLIHNLGYTQALIQSKSIGFSKPHENEETEKESNSSHKA